MSQYIESIGHDLMERMMGRISNIDKKKLAYREAARERKRLQREREKENKLANAAAIDQEILKQFKRLFEWHCNRKDLAPATIFDLFDAVAQAFPEGTERRRVSHYLMPVASEDDMTYGLPARLTRRTKSELAQ